MEARNKPGQTIKRLAGLNRHFAGRPTLTVKMIDVGGQEY